jgi:inosose dehydratase
VLACLHSAAIASPHSAALERPKPYYVRFEHFAALEYVELMRIANAPCSWGALEFEPSAPAASADQVLDEIAATGYQGTELGEWGFFGTDAPQLRIDLNRRCLALAGAFVAFSLTDPAAHATGEATAVKTARLLASAASSPPVVVVADAPAADRDRTARAGRLTPADRLPSEAWAIVAAGVERAARAVREATGLRTMFHQHCATYIETPAEIEALMERTDPDLVGLCLDTGHATYGGGDPVAMLGTYAERIRHVHFKDCSPEVASRARAERWGYLEAIRHGLFCELGQGQVDFGALLTGLRASGYTGWIVVEQDVLPFMGTPAASAQRNRQYLRGLGI